MNCRVDYLKRTFVRACVWVCVLCLNIEDKILKNIYMENNLNFELA